MERRRCRKGWEAIGGNGLRLTGLVGLLITAFLVVGGCAVVPDPRSDLRIVRDKDNLFKPAIGAASSQVGRASTRLPLRVGVLEFEKPAVVVDRLPQGLEAYSELSRGLTAALNACGGFESAELIRRGNERSVDLVVEPRLTRGACWRYTEVFRKQYFKIEFEYVAQLSSPDGGHLAELPGVPLERSETQRYEEPSSQYPYLHKEVGSLIADSFQRFALSICELPAMKGLRPRPAPPPDPPARRSKIDNTRSPVPIDPP